VRPPNQRWGHAGEAASGDTLAEVREMIVGTWIKNVSDKIRVYKTARKKIGCSPIGIHF
jgi:hypothetical protein